MTVTLDNKTTIHSLQEDFNKEFPYLRLEFLSPLRNESNGESYRRFLKDRNKTIGEYRTIKSDNAFYIEPFMTVADLEKYFKELFGLNVMVLRKSGKVWLEVTVSDSWTIEEQNKQGESLSRK